MTDLLAFAVEAHGGIARWNEIKKLTVTETTAGALLHLKGVAHLFGPTNLVAVNTRRQHTELWPLGQGLKGIFEADRTELIDGNGSALEFRDHPRNAFAGHTLTTPWTPLDLVYFGGYAMWTYLTTPFLFTLPGFQTEEIEPWDAEGETWRRLKVTFPDSIHSHSRVQTFYFGPDGILRRHDYSADVLGGTNSANYALEPKSFGGIVIPTKRRVYSNGPDNKPVMDRVAISLDFHSFEVE